MEFRVLHFDYDSRGKPVVPGADQKHGVVKEDSKWWSVSKPAVNRRHSLLCFLWEETPGVFGVFAESAEWSTIDPLNEGISLSNYYDDNEDWLTCRFDGTDLINVYFDLCAPSTIGKEPYTVISWDVSIGADLIINQNVITVQRGISTIHIKCIEAGKLIKINKVVGSQIVGAEIIAEMQKREQKTVKKRLIKLAKKPDNAPTTSKPLILDDAVITHLYPSIPLSIGDGNRVFDIESINPDNA